MAEELLRLEVRERDGNTYPVQIKRPDSLRRFFGGIAAREVDQLAEALPVDKIGYVSRAEKVIREDSGAERIEGKLSVYKRAKLGDRLDSALADLHRKVVASDVKRLRKSINGARSQAAALERDNHHRVTAAGAEKRVSETRKRVTMRMMYPGGGNNDVIEEGLTDIEMKAHVRVLLRETAERHMHPDETPDVKPRDWLGYILWIPGVGTIIEDVVVAKHLLGHGSGRGKLVQIGAALGNDIVQEPVALLTAPINAIPVAGQAAWFAVNGAVGEFMRRTVGAEKTREAVHRVDDEVSLQGIIGLTTYLENEGQPTELQKKLATAVFNTMGEGREPQVETVAGGKGYMAPKDSLLVLAQNTVANAPRMTTVGTEGNRAQWVVANKYADYYNRLFVAADNTLARTAQATSN